ncbi:hypothetical protein J6590_031033 [Homalodisca vitripennis]|nr:hypothetical protein J6590_031033 [Homalodisca vitripennis]
MGCARTWGASSPPPTPPPPPSRCRHSVSESAATVRSVVCRLPSALPPPPPLPPARQAVRTHEHHRGRREPPQATLQVILQICRQTEEEETNGERFPRQHPQHYQALHAQQWTHFFRPTRSNRDKAKVQNVFPETLGLVKLRSYNPLLIYLVLFFFYLTSRNHTTSCKGRRRNGLTCPFLYVGGLQVIRMSKQLNAAWVRSQLKTIHPVTTGGLGVNNSDAPLIIKKSD